MADIWRGALAPRRVWNLSEHLPEDSALSAELAGGPEHRGWTLQTYLLAHLLNSVRIADANNVRVNGGKLKSDPKPVQTPQLKTERPALNLSQHPLAQPLPDKYIRG